MVKLIVSLSLIVWTPAAVAEEVLREISWKNVWQDGEPLNPEARHAETRVSGDELIVANAASEAATVRVLALDDPGITSTRYALTGQVRYEGVEAEGYLEMWSCFGGDKKYFTRTRSPSGPMRVLKGTSDWRRFVLPFYRKQESPLPERLIVNVVLPGRGTVRLGPLRLLQYGPGEDPLALPGQWWSDRTGGYLGGVLGSIVGCMGGAIGWLTSRGRARGVVFGMLRAWQVIGAVGIVGGVVAVVRAQPYGVYYPLLLIGVLCSLLGVGLTRTVRKRFDEAELRKMSAMDAV